MAFDAEKSFAELKGDFLKIKESLEKAFGENAELKKSNKELAALLKEASAAIKAANEKAALQADLLASSQKALEAATAELNGSKAALDTALSTAGKPAVSSIVKLAEKKEPVALTGKTAKVTYKEGGKGKQRTNIPFRLKVPTVNFNGEILTEAEALANGECMKFLAEETLDRAGNSPFIVEVAE